jgi:hypothetical protein
MIKDKCQLPQLNKQKKNKRRWNDKLVNLVHRQKGPASTKYFGCRIGTVHWNLDKPRTAYWFLLR